MPKRKRASRDDESESDKNVDHCAVFAATVNEINAHWKERTLNAAFVEKAKVAKRASVTFLLYLGAFTVFCDMIDSSMARCLHTFFHERKYAAFSLMYLKQLIGTGRFLLEKR